MNWPKQRKQDVEALKYVVLRHCKLFSLTEWQKKVRQERIVVPVCALVVGYPTHHLMGPLPALPVTPQVCGWNEKTVLAL